MKEQLSRLPSVQQVLKSSAASLKQCRHSVLVRLIRQLLEDTRRKIQDEQIAFESREEALDSILAALQAEVDHLLHPRPQRVINATGIVLHTGLGRAPLGPELWQHLQENLAGYVSLEFDPESGERGERLDLCDDLLQLITDAGMSAVVNNNAAAVLLALNTLAERREVIVSRGELIEIGGSFRLPDVMHKSGVRMREVGTTNRTHLRDYRRAIGEDTGAILLAHPSNYRIRGFTTSPDKKEIIELAHRHDIPVIMDLGSGALFPMESVGLPQESVVADMVALGFDVITFSGDKLLGGPQAGIIVGKTQYLTAIRRNPLMRAVRCDKLTFAALTQTLQHYLREAKNPDLQSYRLLLQDRPTLQKRAQKMVTELHKQSLKYLQLGIEETEVEPGSGSMPTETLPSVALVIQSESVSESELARRFRRLEVPVIGYRRDGKFYLDLKAVAEEQDALLIQSILSVGQSR